MVPAPRLAAWGASGPRGTPGVDSGAMPSMHPLPETR